MKKAPWKVAAREKKTQISRPPCVGVFNAGYNIPMKPGKKKPPHALSLRDAHTDNKKNLDK